jgi:S-adenosylmethionine-diacylglycerol 3-amino-3-carboxypropyl transferase
MSLLFDKAFFEQLEDTFSFGDHFREVIRRALTTLPLPESPFLSYALLGRYYDLHHLPSYLRREHIDRIRERLDRITIISGDCGAWFRTQLSESIDRFNFTNIFEWMTPAAYEDLLSEILRVAQDEAVLTYRNLLVRRIHPPHMEPLVTARNGEAHRLHEQDLSFIYRSYVVEDVHKRGTVCHAKSAA